MHLVHPQTVYFLVHKQFKEKCRKKNYLSCHKDVLGCVNKPVGTQQNEFKSTCAGLQQHEYRHFLLTFFWH